MFVLKNLVRTHLLCPHKDCVAFSRSNAYRIQAVIDENRNVQLQKPKNVQSNRLPYLHKLWVRQGICPYCNKELELVIDETHKGRNIYTRKPR